MGMESLIGWAIIYLLASAGIFYSIGYTSGKRDGYLKGRSAGMRISNDRRSLNG